KVIKSCTSTISHVTTSNLGLHHREVRILATKILIKTQRSCQDNGILNGHITVITTSQDFNHLALLALIHHIEASVIILAQILNQALAEHIGLIQICILIFTFTDLGKALGRSIETHKFTELVRGLEV